MDYPADLRSLGLCPLFSGMAPEEIRQVLDALQARVKAFARGETVIEPGSETRALGIVLSGSVQVWQTDFWGHQTLIHKLRAGEVFAESFAVAEQRIPLGVSAAEDSAALFLPARQLLDPPRQIGPAGRLLTQNLTRMIALKNISLTDNIRHLSKRSIESKLLSYLSELAALQGSGEPILPLSRQELADFLCVDRSAMTRALYRMQREGRLTVRGRRIRLYSENPEL